MRRGPTRGRRPRLFVPHIEGEKEVTIAQQLNAKRAIYPRYFKPDKTLCQRCIKKAFVTY